MSKESSELECLPFHVNHLPDSVCQKALEELNETPKNREIQLRKLKDLLSDDECTISIDFKVDFLHVFLRHGKYNSKKAFQNLLKYVKFHRNYTDMFHSVPEKYFTEEYTPQFLSILPYRSPDGCVIVISEIGKWNPTDIPFEDIKRLYVFAFLRPLRCPMTQINGYKIIHDLKDSIKHAKNFTPSSVSWLYNAGFNCIPGRYKEIHFVNNNIITSIIWCVLKLVLSEKMKKRFFFHSNPEDLLNYFPKSSLPTQYGGSLQNYYDSELMKKLNGEYKGFPLEGVTNYF